MFDGQPKELVVYQTADGAEPFTRWLDKLQDASARARIETRLDRLRVQGNPGDYKEADGVYELRIDYGPGYRLYLAFAGRRVVLLLCGGDKRTQAATSNAPGAIGRITSGETNHENVGRSLA